MWSKRDQIMNGNALQSGGVKCYYNCVVNKYNNYCAFTCSHASQRPFSLAEKKVLFLLLALLNNYLKHYLHNCCTGIFWVLSSAMEDYHHYQFISVWFSYLSVLLAAFLGPTNENTTGLGEIQKKYVIFFLFAYSNQYSWWI